VKSIAAKIDVAIFMFLTSLLANNRARHVPRSKAGAKPNRGEPGVVSVPDDIDDRNVNGQEDVYGKVTMTRSRG
jgi:hypothetical protein